MKYTKKYKILERSSDGLMKEPEFSEGYGYKSSFHFDYETEDDAISDIVKKAEKYREFIIVPVIRYTGETT